METEISNGFKIVLEATINTEGMSKTIEKEDKTTHRSHCESKPELAPDRYCPECGVRSYLRSYQLRVFDVDRIPDAFLTCIKKSRQTLIARDLDFRSMYYICPEGYNGRVRIDGSVDELKMCVTFFDVDVEHDYEEVNIEWDSDKQPTVHQVCEAREILMSAADDLGLEIGECVISIWDD